jgi:uncharacterized 2Fe-2S/4Fe-4S cluster protein (DUF4445 family)
VSKTVEVRFLPDGRVSQVPEGTTVFTAAHWIGLAIESTCGGQGTCGKCLVQFETEAAPVSTPDRDFLTPDELAQGWRLACMAPVVEDSVCSVPAVLELPRTATTGVGREVAIEPSIHKVYLELDPPSDEDTRSDLERLQAALGTAGFETTPDLVMLRALPASLRESDFRATACVGGGDLISIEGGDTRETLYGVAFDVGTTTVVGTLVDLRSGEVEGVISDLNRQAVFGGDVISRIAYTMGGQDAREAMRQAVVETLNQILEQLASATGIEPSSIYQGMIVGNSTMLHLLLGIEARSIAVAPFVPVFCQAQTVKASELGVDIHPHGQITTLPAIGAYVGADTLAGLHATGLARQDGLWLFIDVGTNSEIALGSAAGIVATSAPAGPAFEGSCIRAGMAASTGAIDRVALGKSVELSVVGDGLAQGICGSGLIDTVAQLRRVGLLDPNGRLRARSEVADHSLAEHLVMENGERMFALTDAVRLTQRDIRELQSAKSSVATGVQVLMEHLGVESRDIDAVLLAGSFGSAIDPVSARDIGLVPELPLERIRFVGNVAAEGAKMALMSFRERQVAEDLANRVEYVELSTRADFNDLFVDGLSFPSLS